MVQNHHRWLTVAMTSHCLYTCQAYSGWGHGTQNNPLRDAPDSSKDLAPGTEKIRMLPGPSLRRRSVFAQVPTYGLSIRVFQSARGRGHQAGR